MNIVLEYSTEEKDLAAQAIRSREAFSNIEEALRIIRNQLKHGDSTVSALTECLESVRGILTDGISDLL